MIQHYRTTHWDSDSICGTNLSGQRNPIDVEAKHTTCIACKAILEDRPLYGITAVDEDGYTDRQVFNTPAEQLAGIELAFECGAVSVTMQILSVDDLKDGEW